MALWTRWLITLGAMLLASILAGLLWNWLFNADIPSYVSGLVGGAGLGNAAADRRHAHAMSRRSGSEGG